MQYPISSASWTAKKLFQSKQQQEKKERERKKTPSKILPLECCSIKEQDGFVHGNHNEAVLMPFDGPQAGRKLI